MKKTFKVIMLPTEKAINDYSLVLLPRNKLQIMSPSDMIDYLDSQSDATKRQELYITSNDEIKEGDWVINISASKDSQFPIFMSSLHDEWGEGFDHLKKIVATTDKSLLVPHLVLAEDQELSQLPESFIQAYIKAYNEGKPITEVDLEMEQIPLTGRGLSSGYKLVIKTRPDNTVICHTSKMYSRDEVIRLLELSQNATGNISWSDWLDKNP